MRINRLFLTNFRSHRSTEFVFSRLNIGRGTHGAGKTSVQLAIEMLLTGKCDRTDQAGRGAQSLISAGQKELRVEALTDKAELQYRRNGASGELVIGNRAGKAATAWIEGNIAPLPVLSAVLNSGRFLQMDEREQKALLAGALAADPVRLDADMIELAADLGGDLPNEVRDAAEVDRIHKKLFDARAQVNRDLKNLGDIAAPEKPEGMPSRQDVSDLLRQLREQRDTKSRERYKVEGEYQSRKMRLDAATVAKKEYEPAILETDELAKLDKLAKKKTQATKLDAAVADLQSQIRAHREVLCKLMEPQADKCPTCGQPTPSYDRSEPIGRYQSAVKESEEQLAAKQAERLKLGDPATSQAKLDAHFAAIKPYQQAESIIAEIGALGQPPDVSAIAAEIAELDARIEKGQTIERQCTEYEAALAQHQRVTAAKARKEKESEALDKLVEYFSDRRPLKAKLVGGKLPAFTQRINETLARFGFRCHISLEPYEVRVCTMQDRALDSPVPVLNLDQLSESEQYRFSIAFQIALAEATGVNFVVIDRSDMLLPAVRSQLARALDESSLDQAIVLCAGEPLESYPNVEGLTFFELDNIDGATQVRVPNAVEA